MAGLDYAPRTQTKSGRAGWSSQENLRPRGGLQIAPARHERRSDRAAARDWTGNGRAGLEKPGRRILSVHTCRAGSLRILAMPEPKGGEFGTVVLIVSGRS